MRTAAEIETGFRNALDEATSTFIGEKLNDDTVKDLQVAVANAAQSYFESLTNAEVAAYDIKIPRPRVHVSGSNISIESY